MNIILKRIAAEQLTSIFNNQDNTQESQDFVFSVDDKKEAMSAFQNDNPDASKEILNKIYSGLNNCKVISDVKNFYNKLTNFKIGNTNIKLDGLKKTIELSCDLNKNSSLSVQMGQNNGSVNYNLNF